MRKDVVNMEQNILEIEQIFNRQTEEHRYFMLKEAELRYNL